MSALRELQIRFDAALFASDPAARGEIAGEIVAGGLGSSARMSIYRNNLRVGVAKVLALEFPVIERLVGPDFFRQLTLEFMEPHPSRAGDLYEIGAPFAAFLCAEYATTRFEYLADVAALEWAHQRAALAPVAAAFDSSVLRAIPPRAYGSIKFEPTAGCRLVRSLYPILQIWRANQDEAAGDETIDLGDGAEDVLVQRVVPGVQMRSVTPAAATLFQAFSDACDLATAFERAQFVEPDFDLAAQLRRYIDLGAIRFAPSLDSAAVGATLP